MADGGTLMCPYRAQIRAATRAATVDSRDRFAWFGERESALSRRIQEGLSHDGRRQYLVSAIHRRLYESFYCTGSAVPIPGDGPDATSVSSDGHEALARANSGAGSWHGGWTLKRAGSPSEIERGGLSVLVAEGEFRVRESAEAAPCTVELRLPKGLPAASPGFYTALGDQPLDDAGEIARLYWNASSQGMVELMRLLTTTLNRTGAPFRLKALARAHGSPRRDAFVLYVARRDMGELADLLAGIHAEVSPHLMPGTPALTKALAPGLSFADDPADRSSFGMHRCLMIAEGVVQAHESGVDDAPGRLGFVERVFLARGVDLDAPYLNPGAADLPVLQSPAKRAPYGARSPGPVGWTEAAARIAARIRSEAFWAGDRCNWVGLLPGGERHDSRPSQARYAALDGHIYSGTSGVALFLAETYRKTRDPKDKKTALGAMNQALARAAASPRGMPSAFYCGWTGIALAAARIAHLLADESLLESSRALVRRFTPQERPRGPHDQISGSAGAIAPLLALAELLEDDGPRALALAMGDRLVRQATRTAKGCAWSSDENGRSRHLIGWAHGASGVAAALLELHAQIPNPTYRDAAVEAFRFERQWFDPDHGDWRDVRWPSWTGGADGAMTPTWCYGAPGIALSRIRGYEITGDERIGSEAQYALTATAKTVASALPPIGRDLSLCHGMGGLVDVLLESRRELALRGAEGVVRQSLAELEASGPEGAPPPIGLMLGMAGTGYLALRVEDPDVPSVLSVRMDAWTTSCASRNPPRATRRSGA